MKEENNANYVFSILQKVRQYYMEGTRCAFSDSQYSVQLA